MASIYRRTYKVTTPSGEIVTKECETYTIQYYDAAGRKRRVRGYRDLGATKQKAARLEKALARGAEGLVDEYKEHKAKLLTAHLRDWIADLKAAGRDPMYVYTAEKRMAKLADVCGWTSIGEIEPNTFVRWREKARTNTAKGPGRDGKEPAATTLNQYLDTARAFLNWCVKQRRTDRNALADVVKVTGEKKRKRRALTDEQVANLLGVAPPERAIVYRVALAVGLRRSELEQLQWGDVRLMATRPALQLRAEATKARRGDRLDLPPTLASALRAHKPADAKDSARVFPEVPGIDLWRDDLGAAGIPYKDEQGQQADFHSTRKTLCTRMHKAGVPLAAAMRVMRHTAPHLTMVDYADDEQIGNIPALAEVPPAAKAAVAVAAG